MRHVVAFAETCARTIGFVLILSLETETSQACDTASQIADYLALTDGAQRFLLQK